MLVNICVFCFCSVSDFYVRTYLLEVLHPFLSRNKSNVNSRTEWFLNTIYKQWIIDLKGNGFVQVWGVMCRINICVRWVGQTIPAIKYVMWKQKLIYSAKEFLRRCCSFGLLRFSWSWLLICETSLHILVETERVSRIKIY